MRIVLYWVIVKHTAGDGTVTRTKMYIPYQNYMNLRMIGIEDIGREWLL